MWGTVSSYSEVHRSQRVLSGEVLCLRFAKPKGFSVKTGSLVRRPQQAQARGNEDLDKPGQSSSICIYFKDKIKRKY